MSVAIEREKIHHDQVSTEGRTSAVIGLKPGKTEDYQESSGFSANRIACKLFWVFKVSHEWVSRVRRSEYVLVVKLLVSPALRIAKELPRKAPKPAKSFH
ncbi:MAG: hypothetical protein JOY96_11630 [Verrucomicrobia bacterium]|nr:hypothetical protein [Verrucomicrobiota bacterium]